MRTTRYRRFSHGWGWDPVKGGTVFDNRHGDLPLKPHGYYREYDVVAPASEGRGKLRIVLGQGGEVFITGNHYEDFRYVINMPE